MWISVKTIEQLPVWSFGCDSSYSWSQRYKHLAHDASVSEVADRLIEANKNQHNPEGLFTHPTTGQDVMLCFTGGEPMLQQKAMMEILIELSMRGNMPKIVTVETNATKPLSDELRRFIATDFRFMGGKRWHWSMSPKLFNVSGEKDVVMPEVIRELYIQHGNYNFKVCL